MIEGATGSAGSAEAHSAFQVFYLLAVVSILANISYISNQKYSAESVERDCDPEVLSELSVLRDSRGECERINRFRDVFLPLQHVLNSTGSSFLSKETGVFVMFLIWLGLVIFLSLVSARDVQNGHFATLAFVIGGMTALLMCYSVWAFVSSVVSTATMGAVYKGASDAVQQTLVNGQCCGEFVTLLTITAFLVLTYGKTSFMTSHDSGPISDSLCGVALGIGFISMTVRIASGIFSRASNIGYSLLAIETDNEAKANPCFLACLIGDGLSGIPATAVDVASIISEAFVAYAVVASCIFELSILPEFGSLLFPLGVLCGGFLASSLVFRCAQLYVHTYFPESARLDPRELKVWMMRLYRCMLVATFVLLVPVLCVLAHLTLPEEFVITKLTRDLSSSDNHGGKTAANRHMMMFKVTPMLCASITLLGALAGVVIALSAESFYGPRSNAVISLVKTAGYQAGTLTAQADALGHAAILPFVCSFALVAFVGYLLAGSYGICLLTLGVTSLAPLIVGLSSEGGSNYYLARLSELPQPVRSLTRALHEVSLSMRALREGFLLTANTFCVVAVWVALGVNFSSSLPDDDLFSSLNVLQPTVVILVILGAGLPNSFAASLGRSISATGTLIYEEALRITAVGTPGQGERAVSSELRAFHLGGGGGKGAPRSYGYQAIDTKEPLPAGREKGAVRGPEEKEQGQGQGDSRSRGGGRYREDIQFSKRELLRPCALAGGAALRDSLAPALIALLVPCATGIFFGVLPVFAVLIGSLLSSFGMSIPLLVSGQSLEFVRFCLLGHWESRVGRLPATMPSEPALAELFDTEESPSSSWSQGQGAVDTAGMDIEAAALEAAVAAGNPHPTSPTARFRRDSQLAAVAEELSGSARTVVAPSLQAQHKVQGVICLVFIQVFLSINSGRGLFRV